MPDNRLYVISYHLNGQAKEFVLRLDDMNNAEAWHWAACDAGVGIIPRFGRSNVKKVSRPQAERYGISDVRWRSSGAC